ncbi:putative polyphosphoinositide binding protein, partial [Toxoplasma gondii TgCatPRC2]
NDLFSHVNKNQVEERYGGTCPNVKEFDGIFMPPGPFS